MDPYEPRDAAEEQFIALRLAILNLRDACVEILAELFERPLTTVNEFLARRCRKEK